MSIGLYDIDMTLYNNVPFNLELMKLSSYYKKKREIVVLSPSFEPYRFSKFIMRKDYDDGRFPANIKDYDNIEYGGYALSNKQYISLDEAIEKQKPDVFIYERMKDKFCINNSMTAAFSVMMNAQHLRLSLDDKTIWNNYSKQILNFNSRTMFFHDYDLNKIDGAKEIVTDLMNNIERVDGGFLATKFPIKTYNLKDLKFWCGFQSSCAFSSVQYCGLMKPEELEEFINDKSLQTSPRKIEYVITYGVDNEEDFSIRVLPEIYKQVLFLRMHRQKILLKYEEDFFVDKRWERLIDFFNHFMSTALAMSTHFFDITIKYDSLYSFAFKLKDFDRTTTGNYTTKSEARELFNFVREKNYEVFENFYEGHTVKLIGGELKYDSITD